MARYLGICLDSNHCQKKLAWSHVFEIVSYKSFINRVLDFVHCHGRVRHYTSDIWLWMNAARQCIVDVLANSIRSTGQKMRSRRKSPVRSGLIDRWNFGQDSVGKGTGSPLERSASIWMDRFIGFDEPIHRTKFDCFPSRRNSFMYGVPCLICYHHTHR